MTGKNTGLNKRDTKTHVMMNIRLARQMIENGDLRRADAALMIAEVGMIDVGSKDLGPIPDVQDTYNNVERIISKYQQKVERLEFEKEKLEEKVDKLEQDGEQESIDESINEWNRQIDGSEYQLRFITEDMWEKVEDRIEHDNND